MADKKETVLITGITGQQGGAVARQLMKDGWPVMGLTRHPDKADEIKKLGARIVVGDLTDRPSFESAVDGIKRSFWSRRPMKRVSRPR